MPPETLPALRARVDALALYLLALEREHAVLAQALARVVHDLDILVQRCLALAREEGREARVTRS